MYICNKIHMSSLSYMQTHDFLTNVYEKSMCCDLKAFVLLLLVFVFFQAWWFTENLYTDLWGRWVMENNDNVWVYMDIPTSYRKGKTNHVKVCTFGYCLFSLVNPSVYVHCSKERFQMWVFSDSTEEPLWVPKEPFSEQF